MLVKDKHITLSFDFDKHIYKQGTFKMHFINQIHVKSRG